MQKVKRSYLEQIVKKLKHNPAVALLGSRQVGKSTLAREIVALNEGAIYLDLELASDRVKLERDPELFFKVNNGVLVCLDEIQFLPEIFQTLRSIIDREERNGQFLILGSASRDLIKQSSETLAGRISYMEITPFSRGEISNDFSVFDYWVRGGYPRSLLADDGEISFDWRKDYISSFLERDLPMLGFRVPVSRLNRLWTMLAHNQGQVINFARLGSSLGISGHTLKHYIDILEQTFIVRVLTPYFTNGKKRLVKSPKVYIRDTGLLHALLEIESMNDLLGHPVIGSSYEALVIESVLKKYPRHRAHFYRDSSGNEVDLLLIKGEEKIAIEIKSSTAPKVGKGFWNAVKFLKPSEKWVIAQVDSPYPGEDELQITNLDSFLSSSS